MRPKVSIAALVLGTAFLLTGASAVSENSYFPDANGAALWGYINGAGNYQGYRYWPGKEGYTKGREPHGAILRTFINPQAYLDIQSGKTEFSPGAIIVKEGYTSTFQPTMTVVMYKVKGYNPGNGNWFWAKYSPTGTVEKEGKVDGCIKCHSSAKEVDYSFSKKP